jgi:hypothetical protein
MADCTTIRRTEFRNLAGGEVTYGFRIYNDFDQSYSNTLGGIPQDDMELLRLAKEKHGIDTVQEIFDALEQQEEGIYVDETYYEWEQIKHLFKS